MGARWYEAGSASFLSRDTIRGELVTPISLNRYTYAWANPMNYWDPDGKYTFVADGAYYGDGTFTPSNTTTTSKTSAETDAEVEANFIATKKKQAITSTNKKTSPANETASETIGIIESRVSYSGMFSAEETTLPSTWSLIDYDWVSKPRSQSSAKLSFLELINPVYWPILLANETSQGMTDLAYFDLTLRGYGDLVPTAPQLELSSYIDVTGCVILCLGFYGQSSSTGGSDFGITGASIGTPGVNIDLGLRTAYSDEIAVRSDGLAEGLSAEVVGPGVGGYGEWGFREPPPVSRMGLVC